MHGYIQAKTKTKKPKKAVASASAPPQDDDDMIEVKKVVWGVDNTLCSHLLALIVCCYRHLQLKSYSVQVSKMALRYFSNRGSHCPSCT